MCSWSSVHAPSVDCTSHGGRPDVDDAHTQEYKPEMEDGKRARADHIEGVSVSKDESDSSSLPSPR